jgi:hypothetical protein
MMLPRLRDWAFSRKIFAGAVRSKAVYRFWGTMLDAIAPCALVGLRRALFPHAPPYEPEPAEPAPPAREAA